MAPLAKSLALAGSLLATFASAVPMEKRDVVIVYETSTSVVWTTVDITTTIYANPPSATAVVAEDAAPAGHKAEPEHKHGHKHQSLHSTTTQAPPVITQEPEPQPEPTSSTQSTTTAAPPPPPPPPPPANPPPANPPPANPPPANPPPANGGGSSGGSPNGSCTKDSPCAGDVTFYDTATSMSAPSSCGFTSDGLTENVIALSHELMSDSDCGRKVSIRYGGSVKTGKVVDKCMGCSRSSIDLSRHFFNELASEDAGRLSDVEWWLD
ncbi:hypothetical protein EYZ11_009838 [Aspergillus tanneri]|uniref:RlpA-like protein double-psi beta-barrel domain-containing protein n=1 Tax=Aspergillus tanneri TaxID=1220188 RepID=A0A4S3JC89_9EURO|nr:uncharacterized protein ATNIH1004_005066 [Aspergillus tanneri]KAA8649171.1 hypothetical protein ATNIH1004_005066 [Aspergillus tanneri]THC90701.1 hypothetical protein EYZ11_009838 [Aspergillus tanneri]